MDGPKDENANKQILNETMASIEGRIPAGANESWEDMVDLLWKWHIKSKTLSPFISDHLIFRAFNGILANIPEDLQNKITFLRFIFSELFEEYSTIIPRDTVMKELMQFEIFSSMMDDDKETVFYYQSSPAEDGGVMPHHVQVRTLPDTIKK